MKSGRYNLTNLADCVRLVQDSRPNRQRQEAMLNVIERTPGTPQRDEILNSIKTFDKGKDDGKQPDAVADI